MIFDPKPRAFGGPKPRNGADFEYLNSSSRPEAERVRELLERLCSYYPCAGRSELVARLRASRKDTHLSAVFELVLHEIFYRTGSTLTPHPELGDTSRRPEFRIRTDSGFSFLLEATLCFERGADVAGEKRLQEAYDIIDRMASPCFFIGVESEGIPSAPLDTRRLKKRLTKWLGGLERDLIASEHTQRWFMHSDQGVRLKFIAIPKRDPARPGRTIGFTSSGGQWSRVRASVKSRLHDKVGKYGNPDSPLI